MVGISSGPAPLLLGAAPLMLYLLAGEPRRLERPDVIAASLGYLACAVVARACLESSRAPTSNPLKAISPTSSSSIRPGPGLRELGGLSA